MSKKQNRVSEAKTGVTVTGPKQGIYPSHLLKNVNPWWWKSPGRYFSYDTTYFIYCIYRTYCV